MSNYHKEDEDVFRIPFEPDEVKRLERLGFKKTHDKDDTYVFEVLLNAWEDNETGLVVTAYKYNGNHVLVVGEDDDGKELFSMQAPFDYVMEKLEPILPKLKQKQADQHEKNQEKWAVHGEPLIGGGFEDPNNRRFKMSEYVKSIRKTL